MTKPLYLKALPVAVMVAMGAFQIAHAAEAASATKPAAKSKPTVAEAERFLNETEAKMEKLNLDGSRVVTVGANAEGMPLSAVVGEIEKRIGKIQLPAGYSRKQGG